MMALLGLFLKENWLSIAIVGGVVVVASSIYVKGRSDGAAVAREDARTAVFNQLKERNITDGKVKGMSDPELCRALGGVLIDKRCQ